MGDNIDEYLDEVYSIVINSVGRKRVNVSDLIHLTQLAMESVEKYRDLSGPQKKNLVIRVIVKIIDDSDLIPAEYEQVALEFTETFLPVVIDGFVGAFNRVINLRKHGANGGCTSCFKK